MNKRPPRNGEVVAKKMNVLLIDGNSLFKTSYFAGKNTYNSSGQNVGGLYVFLNIFRKVLTDDLYHRVYVFWDGNFSGKLRFEIYEPYKSGRGKDYVNGTQPIDVEELKQRKMVWDYLNEMYVRQIKDEVVESDDLIAYYCNNRKPNEKITIVSSDRDFLQLLSDDIRIYFLDLKEYIDMNNYSLYFCFHQSNSVLIKTMTGDNSDSIKGIKGLGQTKLLSLFPEIKERKITMPEIIEMAKAKQQDRIDKKMKPLSVLDNIINAVTDGVQKENVYTINERLVDLSKPFITKSSIEKLNYLNEGTLDDTGRELKNVLSMMKRDGLDELMGKIRYEEFLIPFKGLIRRENNQ